MCLLPVSVWKHETLCSGAPTSPNQIALGAFIRVATIVTTLACKAKWLWFLDSAPAGAAPSVSILGAATWHA